jgi:hypothetical protein
MSTALSRPTAKERTSAYPRILLLCVYAAVWATVSVASSDVTRCQWHTQLQEEMITRVLQERFKDNCLCSHTDESSHCYINASCSVLGLQQHSEVGHGLETQIIWKIATMRTSNPTIITFLRHSSVKNWGTWVLIDASCGVGDSVTKWYGTGWHSGIALDLYSGCARFESLPGHRLCWQVFLVFLFWFLRANTSIRPILLPSKSFPIHHSPVILPSDAT